MRRIIAITFLFSMNFAWSQNEPIILRTFVKKDTVQLRWVPTSVAVLIDGLQNGYQIERKGSDGTKTFEILPFSERKSSFVAKDSFEIGLSQYVEDFSKATPSDLLDMPFAILTLGASPYQSIAKLSGVYFEDIKVPNGTYTYQVKSKDGKSLSTIEKVKSSSLSKNPDCSELFGESRIDLKEVYMKWEAKELNEAYGGYWILKSEDNKSFYKLNETPLFHFTSQYEADKTIIDFVDTTVSEGETYYYQIQPMNQFGDPGTKSNVIEVYIQQRLQGSCVIDTVRMKDFNREIEGMYLPAASDGEVGEFILMRSDSVLGPYKELERKKAIENNFIFNYKANLTSGDRHYFKVIALSVDGDSAYSFPYYHFSLDQIPPGACSDLKGQIDSLGIARLSWDAPADNDIQGYRLFRANSEKGEYIEVTRKFAQNGQFADTLFLGSLTNEVYYKVRAVDLNFNNGPVSKGVRLLKPDTIPPVPSVFKKYEVKKEGIYLRWANSSSEDLKNQYVLRTSTAGTDTVLTFLKEHDTILDVTGRVGMKYAYTMMAEDESGNISKSEVLNLKYEIGYRPAPKFTNVAVDREAKLIKLEWEQSLEEVYAIQIYRSKGEGKMRLYKTIREEVNIFEDKDLNINNEYHYKLQIKYRSGIQSKIGEKTSVVY